MHGRRSERDGTLLHRTEQDVPRPIGEIEYETHHQNSKNEPSPNSSLCGVGRFQQHHGQWPLYSDWCLSVQANFAKVPTLFQVSERFSQLGETKHAIYHGAHRMKFNSSVHGFKHLT
jgi:hypothetical protein